jgi:hypothetical protein
MGDRQRLNQLSTQWQVFRRMMLQNADWQTSEREIWLAFYCGAAATWGVLLNVEGDDDLDALEEEIMNFISTRPDAEVRH